jgi:hypothetical protein
MDSKFIINLFGTGIRYWICEIPIPLYEEMNKIRINKKVEWENLLFDFDFLKHFGFDHWSELSPHPEQTGFFLDPKNRIEIKQGAKFIARFRANELMNSETLFPLYQTSQFNLEYTPTPNTQHFILVQFEKGLVAKFKFEAKQFSIDELTFKIQILKNLAFLGDIELNHEGLQRSSDDTVTTGSLVYQV